MKNQKGQATMEFALSILLMSAFLFFFFQMAMSFAWGNYVQYATFLSARAYLAGGVSKADQAERARDVARQMLMNKAGKERMQSVAKGEGGADSLGGNEIPGLFIDEPDIFGQSTAQDDLSWAEGVRYRFRSRLFVMPLSGVGNKLSKDQSSVLLQSESWLGRHPTTQECDSFMTGRNWIYDNGC